MRLLSGEDELEVWAPAGGSEKLHCRRCGSALFMRPPGETDFAGVRLGALDADPGIRPQWRQYVAYAASWEEIPDDGLPRYPEGKPS